MSDGEGFIPYGRQWVTEEDILSVRECLESDFLTQGPRIERFEAEIKDATGSRYCVAVTSATAALHIAVAALGLKEGLSGITAPNTFVATSNSLIYNGLIPEFADIDARTYCIDPSSLEKALSPSTAVFLPVDFAGQPADMETIYAIAKKHGISVIEDASHAIGSTYLGGFPVGSCKYSDMTVFSFHPVKTITTGEGGAVTTNDESVYKRLLRLRNHGIVRDPDSLEQNPGPWYYEMQELGFNYRMTDIQAALGASQMRRLPSIMERRRAIVSRYNLAFSSMDSLVTPYETPGVKSCFHLYVVRIDFERIGKSRKLVMEELRSKGIGTQVHYIPVHLQPYYRKRYGYKQGDFPRAEAYYREALSLPLFPKMSDKDIDRVVASVKSVVGA
jgi:UDP-4-amino-4,6-dideoxy-N-acetyl-beta-L-altrosamine transaminase